MKTELELLATLMLEKAMDQIAKEVYENNKVWLEKEILRIIKNNRDLKSLIKNKINYFITENK